AVDGERAVAGNLHGAGIGRILPVDHARVWTGIRQGLQVNQAAGVALEVESVIGIGTHIDHHAPGGALVIKGAIPRRSTWVRYKQTVVGHQGGVVVFEPAVGDVIDATGTALLSAVGLHHHNERAIIIRRQEGVV